MSDRHPCIWGLRPMCRIPFGRKQKQSDTLLNSGHPVNSPKALALVLPLNRVLHSI